MTMVRRAAMLAAAFITITACSGSGSSSSSEPAAAEPRPGGELSFVLATEPSTLNPIIGVNQDRIVATAFIDRLVGTDKSGQPAKTGIATGWQQPDPQTWRFTLKSGVAFSNGEPLDAGAAAFSIQTTLKETGSLKTLFSVITAASAPDPATLEVKTKVPTNAIPALLTSLWLFPPKYYAQVGGKQFGQAPIGSGPFKFESWEPGKKIRAVRNDGHWRGKPYLDAIAWTFAPDASTRVGLLTSGAAMVVQNLTTADQKGLASNSKVNIHRVNTTGTMGIGINIASGALGDLRLRQAMAMAIDRKAIVTAIFGGNGVGATVSPTFFPPIFNSGPTYPDSISYDLSKAQSLVKQVGGTPQINFTYTTNRYASDSDVGEAISGMLEKAGFKVTRTPLDGVSFFGKLNNAKAPIDGAYMFTYVAVYPHQDVLVHTFFTSDATTHYCADPAFDGLSATGLSASTDAQRTQAYNQIEDRVLNKDVCWIPLYTVTLAYGESRKVHNFGAAIDQLVDYFPTWLG